MEVNQDSLEQQYTLLRLQGACYATQVLCR